MNLTVPEARDMASMIGPLLKQGLSPYQILQIHPELGISSLDLRRQVSRRISRKKANTYKKRADNRYLQGRTYKDYKAYMLKNPDVFVTQMDTVYNNESTGPFLQTFKFIGAGVLFAVLHSSKTSRSMKNGVDLLDSVLGTEIFRKYVHVLLTDRGCEFSFENTSR